MTILNDYLEGVKRIESANPNLLTDPNWIAEVSETTRKLTESLLLSGQFAFDPEQDGPDNHGL